MKKKKKPQFIAPGLTNNNNNKNRPKKNNKNLPLCYISFCLWVGQNCQIATYTFWIKIFLFNFWAVKNDPQQA